MPHQNTVLYGILKLLPWARFDELVGEAKADHDPRAMTSKQQLIAMVYAQLSGARSLRDIETGLRSHAGKLSQLGGCAPSRSTLATANRSRPAEVYGGLLSAVMAQLQRGFRRKMRDSVRLIDSTSVELCSLSRNWASFSATFCGAKAHIIYDPDADQPVYLMTTAAKVNDITAAKQMPIEPGATYVFDLGYYDYGWWAKLHRSGCRFVTRLKNNTPVEIVEERAVPAGSQILSDQVGHLPKRLAASRKNPMDECVREIKVVIETGKVLRLVTNDLTAEAQEIADLYKRRWQIELFFRWVKQTLKITHFFGTSENAVRIQITVALITFVLLRLAHEANQIVKSPLAFARLIRANLMHRRPISELLKAPPKREILQTFFEFRAVETRATHRRRLARSGLATQLDALCT